MKTTLDLTIHPGLTFGPVEILCKDAAGAAVPLAGWRAFAEVRAKPGTELILDLAPVIAGGDTLGKVTLPRQDPTVTSLLPVGEYQWELILEDTNLTRFPPLLGGRVKIFKTICDAVAFPPAET
jgi:hypothetical protein